MTALKGKAVEAFVERRDPSVRAVLIYGPDEGLVRERARKIGLSVVADLNDPFNAIELTDADLKAEPGRLADEAAALSFMGGERLIRVRTSGDGAHAAAAILLAGLDGGGLRIESVVVIEAGDLAKSSKLRKAFEASKTARALPCYSDGALDIRGMAQNMARKAGLRIDPEALDLIAASLGEDRGVSRAELEKLMLYAGPEGAAERTGLIDRAAVQASIVDSLGDAAHEVAAAAANGDMPALSVRLQRCRVAGASPIALLRAGVREFDRLRQARAAMSAGASVEDAMKKLRPPVFFMEQRPFEARLRRWGPEAIDRALDNLLQAERAAKTTGAPQTEIVERTFFAIALLPGRPARVGR